MDCIRFPENGENMSGGDRVETREIKIGQVTYVVERIYQGKESCHQLLQSYVLQQLVAETAFELGKDPAV